MQDKLIAVGQPDAATDRPMRKRLPLAVHAQRAGVPADELALLWQTVGLPPPRRDEPFLTEAEARAFVEIASLGDAWTPELSLRLARVMGPASVVGKKETDAR